MAAGEARNVEVLRDARNCANIFVMPTRCLFLLRGLLAVLQ